jgi:hypothetical protein
MNSEPSGALQQDLPPRVHHELGGKRNINYAGSVNVPDLCPSEKEFPSIKAMGVNVGPLRYLILQLCNLFMLTPAIFDACGG